MALSASAKENLSRLFPGDPSPLWDSDPEFMELFTNFALGEVVDQGSLDEQTRMMAVLAALLGCQGVSEYREQLPAALRALPRLLLGVSGCSTMVFQAPQAGHFPAHLGNSLPQAAQ